MTALPWKMMKNVLWSTSQSSISSGACQHICVPFTVLGNGPNRRLQISSQQQCLEMEEKQQHLSQNETAEAEAETETLVSAEVVSYIILTYAC